jgi:hypothetical protein
MRACEWCAQNKVIQSRNSFRRHKMQQIITLGEALRNNGSVDHWVDDCDSHTRDVIGDMNGPLVMELMGCLEYPDTDLADMLKGAPLLGEIQTSGRGVAKELKTLGDIESLWSDRHDITEATRLSLKPSELDEEVLRQTIEEAKVGRVSMPVTYNVGDFDGVASSRFGVVQNSSVRLIDNGTASRCNPCAGATERIREHRLDTWFELTKYMYLLGILLLSTCKVDVSAAFKRIPVHPGHRWAAGTLFHAEGVVKFIQQYAMQFGFVGSVYAWERFSNFLWCVIVGLLYIPLGKYVDDFYGVEHPECIECALECITGVFRAIMGPTSLSCKKILYGNPLGLLGFQVFAGSGFARFSLVEDKRTKWLALVQGYLAAGTLYQREAAQLAGRLAFASLFLFRRLGRAMLRPLFRQQHHGPKDGSMNLSLQAALQWWVTALREQRAEDFPFDAAQGGTAEIFCDAAGSPPHICAVIFIDGESFYCHDAVPQWWMDWFEPRRDAQIMGLELLAILYAILNFLPLIQGKTVRVWTDNEGGKGSMSSGAARSWDHNQLVHRVWEVCYHYCVTPWFDRVPTDENIADGPTRADMLVVAALGSVLFSAQLPLVV